MNVRSVGGTEIFLLFSAQTQPPIQWILEALSMGVKWSVHEGDHSPPTSAKFKKRWIYTYTSTPQYVFMA
jgi:hypothetical protein